MSNNKIRQDTNTRRWACHVAPSLSILACGLSSEHDYRFISSIRLAHRFIDNVKNSSGFLSQPSTLKLNDIVKETIRATARPEKRGLLITVFVYYEAQWRVFNCGSNAILKWEGVNPTRLGAPQTVAAELRSRGVTIIPTYTEYIFTKSCTLRSYAEDFQTYNVTKAANDGLIAFADMRIEQLIREESYGLQWSDVDIAELVMRAQKRLINANGSYVVAID